MIANALTIRFVTAVQHSAGIRRQHLEYAAHEYRIWRPESPESATTPKIVIDLVKKRLKLAIEIDRELEK